MLIRSGLLKSKVLIVGAGEAGERALQALRRESNLGYEVVGFIDDKSSKKQTFVNGVKVHNSLNHIERYIKNCDIQDVVIALTNVDKRVLAQLINQLQLKAKSVLYVPDFAGMAVIGTELRHFFHDQFFAVEINNNLIQPLNYVTKKIFDYAVCLVLSLLLFIPIVIISIVIRITSPGPAIHKQQRIGKNSIPFMCYKFRTMYCDAEQRLNKILSSDPEAKKEWETYWKLKNDPRVTPLGNFLRRTSLDELPQIFNVLKGEMSIVGPRPYLPREWGSLKEYSEIIHSVPPGITGLWQVSGRSNSTYEQRLSLDSWYVRNWNLWIDIVILFRTVYVVLKKEGAT
jgi:Undecaprenyl-phosphate galactose phosphotransferase WbaP